MTIEGYEDSGATDTESSEVDVTSLSEAELEQALATAYAGEDELGVEETEEEDEVEAQSKEDAAGEEAQADSETSDELPTLAQLRDENARLQAQLKQSEYFNQRRGNEIGELRKQVNDLVAYRASLEEGWQERLEENPAQALEERDEIRRTDEEIRKLQQKEALVQVRQASERAFSQHFKPGEVAIENMVRCLEADGIDGEHIKAFLQDPLATSPDTLVQLGKRAKAESDLQQLIPYTRNLLEEVKRLREEVKSKGSDVLQKVRKNLNAPPRITPKTGASARKRSISLDDHSLANLSDAEFEALYAEVNG